MKDSKLGTCDCSKVSTEGQPWQPSAAAGSEREAFYEAAKKCHARCELWARTKHNLSSAEQIDELSDIIRQAARAAAPPNDGFLCAARHGDVGANDPQDCNWPFCGCDQRADKVIEAIQESGFKIVPEAAAPPSRMDFWFHLADKVCQKFGIPFLKIDEVGLFMQNEARHLVADSGASPQPHGHQRESCVLCTTSCTHGDEWEYGKCKLTDHARTTKPPRKREHIGRNGAAFDMSKQIGNNILD